MDLNITLTDIQIGKNYNLSFCLTEDGIKTMRNVVEKKKPKEDGAPKLEDFQNKEEQPPTMEKPKFKNDIKIESSFSGKIKPT